MYMLDFGERLRALRKEKGYTQKVIAEKMNVSQNTVVRWENNYKFPTQNNLIQLSRIFHVSLDYLVGDRTKTNNCGRTAYAGADHGFKYISIGIPIPTKGNGTYPAADEYPECCNCCIYKIRRFADLFTIFLKYWLAETDVMWHNK